MGKQLATGQQAPDFQAGTHDEQRITLSQLIQSKSVVLVLIRGFG